MGAHMADPMAGRSIVNELPGVPARLLLISIVIRLHTNLSTFRK